MRTRYIDAWYIWVYYNAPTPTATRTSTRTPTRTFTRTSTRTNTPTQTPQPTYRFSGNVFEGLLGDETHPLAGVTVNLYGSNDAGSMGMYIDSALTNASGAFALSTGGAIWEYYNIIETNLPGMTSEADSTPAGHIISLDWIQYSWPIANKNLSGNKFWDRRSTITGTPTATPTRTTTRTQTPTATLTPGGQPGLVVDKRVISPPLPAVVSQTVRFEIYIRNTGPESLKQLYLSDTYSTTYLSYLGSSTPPSDDDIDDGEITWSNLVTYFGEIHPGQTVSVSVAFHADAPTGKHAGAQLRHGQLPVWPGDRGWS